METAHIALRFVTLGPSEVDAKMVLIAQRSPQGVHNARGINARTERDSILELKKRTFY
jgi:hypothetical protein